MRYVSFVSTAAALALACCPIQAQAKAGDWLLRVRAIMVAPTDGGNNGPVLPAFPTGSVNVDNSVMPEIDITYMVTDHIGLELIAATTKHTAKGSDALKGLGGLVDTWVLPPTLTAQYHFIPDGKIRPYVGVGINWTLFYSEDATRNLEDAIGSTKVKMNSDWGYAAQIGVDVDVTERFFVNFDVKYIDINTSARLTTTTPSGPLVNRVKIDLDPIVAGVGLGFRF
jgi:outer membrane protein